MLRLFQNILCPVDFSDYSILAVRYASALAEEYDARLIVYHSVPNLEQVSIYLGGHYIQTVTEDLLSNGREKLEEFASKLIPKRIETLKEIGKGNPPDAILELVKRESVDLIVMGTHGYTGYQKFLLGSVTNNVLHRCTVPVLAVCNPQHHFIHEDMPRPVNIQRILCAVDFEPNSKRIAAFALDLARTYASQIDFLHIARKEEGTDWFQKEKRAVQLMRELVRPEQEEWCTARFLVEAGEPGMEILKAVQRHGIDLVILGHHTRKPVEEYLLGSVAKRVIPAVACPALIIRSEADLVYDPEELVGKQASAD